MRQDVDSRGGRARARGAARRGAGLPSARPTTWSGSGRCSPTDDEVIIPRVHREALGRPRADDGAPRRLPAAGHHGAGGGPGAEGLGRRSSSSACCGGRCSSFGVLHADPHPGNYLVTHHPKIGILDFGSVRVFEPEVRLGYLRVGARAARRRRRRGRRRVRSTWASSNDGQDPAPFVEMLRIVCEPILVDRAVRSARLRRRGARAARSARSSCRTGSTRRPATRCSSCARWPGSTATSKAFGTVRNWHRIFRDIVDAVPDDGGRIAMRRWFAMSAIGRDRPGIVADLAELIYECDCNLEDSRMTILGSEFAVLLLLSGQGDDVERRLSSGCKRLEWEKRLTVFIRPLDEPPPVAGEPPRGVAARVRRHGRRQGRDRRARGAHRRRARSQHHRPAQRPPPRARVGDADVHDAAAPGGAAGARRRRRCARRSSAWRPSCGVDLSV